MASPHPVSQHALHPNVHMFNVTIDSSGGVESLQQTMSWRVWVLISPPNETRQKPRVSLYLTLSDLSSYSMCSAALISGTLDRSIMLLEAYKLQICPKQDQKSCSVCWWNLQTRCVLILWNFLSKRPMQNSEWTVHCSWITAWLQAQLA